MTSLTASERAPGAAMSTLPNDREKALAAIAAGWGREPTAAHPDCRCGRPYQPSCPACYAQPNKPCRMNGLERPAEHLLGEHYARPDERIARKSDCPVHRKQKDT